MKDHRLIFVPGIMGSELYYEGPNPKISDIRQGVWVGDHQVILDTIAFHPELLHLKTKLSVGTVLYDVKVKVSAFSRRRVEVYGPLIRFLQEKLGYIVGENMLLFAYDWRQSNATTAETLAATLRKKYDRNEPLKFVCHSMGGIVVRLLLADPRNKDLRERTRSFVQIGVPVRGSSKAFKALKYRPEFGKPFDVFVSLRHHVQPLLLSRLLNAINSFPSLFEIMPPDSEQIAIMQADHRYHALHDQLWPDLEPQHLDVFRQIQSRIALDPIACSLSLYSDDVPTEREYLVDRNFAYVQPAPSVILGDGVVSSASATLATNRILPVSGHVRHEDLPNDQYVVWPSLERELIR